MAKKIKLDYAGLGEVLKSSEVQASVDTLAAQAAALVDETASGKPVPVRTSSFKTDRAVAAVTLAHPAGLAVEAKRGALARAAAAIGLEVTERKA